MVLLSIMEMYYFLFISMKIAKRCKALSFISFSFYFLKFIFYFTYGFNIFVT